MGFLTIFAFATSCAIACYLLIVQNVSFAWDLLENRELMTSSKIVGISPFLLVFIRSLFGLTIWYLNFSIMLDSEGLKMTVLDRKGGSKVLHLFYLERFTMFTVWSWVLQGIYFLFAILIYAYEYNIFDVFGMISGGNINNSVILLKYFTRITWVLYEINFAVALFISVVVTYVLIPGQRAKGLPVERMFTIIPLTMHNANVIFMAIEMFLNKLPFVAMHACFIILYAISYVVFSWFWMKFGHGIFYYFFLDYDKPYALAWHVALLIALSLFYLFGVILTNYVESNYTRALLLCGATYMSIKIRNK
jgi:hypothetical protein